jgi:hypothetical protein
MADGRFKPGNTLNTRRKHKSGGRPPKLITNIRQDLEENPGRARDCLDKLYYLAMNGSDRVALAAASDYLDRMGFRMPKEANVRIEGMVSIGSPEYYRRAVLLLANDKEQEKFVAPVKLLPDRPES